MNKIILNAFGEDRPGLVSKITKVISSKNGNIETSKMVQLESDFTLLMLIEIKSDNIDSLINELNEIEKLEISFKKTDKKENEIKYNEYSFKVNVADSGGIIYIFSNLFKEHKINITDMDTYIKNAANTGFPIFFLKANIMIPEKCDIEELTKNLNRIAQKNNIEYKLIKNN